MAWPEGAANQRIGELGPAVVHLERDLVGDALVAGIDHADIGQGVEPRHLGERHGREGRDLDVAGLQGRRLRARIGQHAKDDLVEQRQALGPVVRIALEPVELARPMLGEDEGAGADRCQVQRVLGDVGALVEMPGQDGGQRRQRILDELRRRRHREAEDGRVVVRCVDGLEIGEHHLAQVLQRLPDLHGAERHVGRGEGRAIVEGHALAQLDREAEAVLRRPPRMSPEAAGGPSRSPSRPGARPPSRPRRRRRSRRPSPGSGCAARCRRRRSACRPAAPPGRRAPTAGRGKPSRRVRWSTGADVA